MSLRVNIEKLKRLGAFSAKHAAVIATLSLVSLCVELVAVAFIPAIAGALVGKQGTTGSSQFDGVASVIPKALAFLGVGPSLGILLMVFGIVILVRQIVTFCEVLTVERSAMWAYRNISGTLFRAWMAGSMEEVARVGQGTWVTAFVRHCQISSQVIPAYARLFRVVLTVAVYLAIAIWMSPQLVLLSIGYCFVIYWPLRYVISVAKWSSKKAVESQNMSSDFVADSAGGWRQIRIFDLTTKMSDRFVRFVDKMNEARWIQSIASNATPIILVFAFLIFAAVLQFVLPSVMDIDVTVVALLAVLALRILPMLQVITSRSAAIAVNGQSLMYVSDALDNLAGDQRSAIVEPNTLGPIKKGIRFDSVSFSYVDSSRSAVRDITLDIPTGKLIAICGPSGSGKSTFVDLIALFLRPKTGHIYYDGVDQGNLSPGTVLRHIALATQEPFIFQGSVLENISAARPGASRRQVVEAARAAGIDEIISELPRGYDTLVGQAGHGMSGGQKQRLALARMFLSEASVLIFDEPTSALDEELEEAIITAIKNHCAKHNKTALVITHRRTVREAAEATIVFRDGKANYYDSTHGENEALPVSDGR